jgi:hypothetical protein
MATVPWLSEALGEVYPPPLMITVPVGVGAVPPPLTATVTVSACVVVKLAEEEVMVTSGVALDTFTTVFALVEPT